jgi:hypothetical protein
MSIHTCSSVTCNQPFHAHQFSRTNFRLCYAPGITCPNCGYEMKGEVDSVYLTYPLAPEELLLS